MKKNISGVVTATLVALLTLAPGRAVPEQPSRLDTALARLAQRNFQAEALLETLARKALEESGDRASETLAHRLAQLKALCVGVSEDPPQPPAERYSQSPTLQTADLRVVKVDNPLCRRLTARYA